MPNEKITDQAEDAAPASNDWLVTVDVSDTTASPQGTNKKVQIGNLGSASIADDSVTNAKLANMATQTIKGRTTAGSGDPEDLTATQATAILNAMVGDSGSGGTKGLVPAPGAGDAAAGKFLKADGTFAVPGGGTAINPTNNRIPKRTDASNFGDSFLAHDASNSRTESIQHFVLDTTKIIGYGDAALARKNVGVLRVVSDTAFAPASIISETAALAFPGGTPTPWASSGMNFRYVATANFALGNPGGGASDGYRFTLMIVQDATGSRVITWSSAYKFAGGTLPTLTTAANAVDIFEFIYYSSTAFCIGQFLDVK